MVPAKGEILVVDDDDDVREALGELLEVEGYETVTCANGREALEWLRGHPLPDLIVLDLMMPVMSGTEFLVEHNKDARLASIPVVVVTAGDDLSQARRLGARSCLNKPMRLETLLEAIG